MSRFLAVESCGQCTPCKQDGLELAALLARLAANDGSDLDLVSLADRARTVSKGARCSLAIQHETIVTSLLDRYHDRLDDHAAGRAVPVEVRPIVPIDDLRGPDVVVDLRELDKQPDWTFDPADSGKSPADRIDQRAQT